jgi:hypothetical protein
VNQEHAKRKAAYDSAPRVQVNTSHLQDAVLLPSRLAMLDALPKSMRCLEVGVAKGDFSAELLARCNPISLDLVDLWGDARFGPGLEIVMSRFHQQINEGIVRLHQTASIEFLKENRSQIYDFIYIDTDHSYPTTREELRLAAGLITENGFLAGHDFTAGNVVDGVVYGVMPAVLEFCVEFNWRFFCLTVEPAGWNSFCLQKI